jgi:hypothetical protein
LWVEFKKDFCKTASDRQLLTGAEASSSPPGLFWSVVLLCIRTIDAFTPPNQFGMVRYLNTGFGSSLSAVFQALGDSKSKEKVGNQFGAESGSVFQDRIRCSTGGPYSQIFYRCRGRGSRVDPDPGIRICISLSHPCTGPFEKSKTRRKKHEHSICLLKTVQVIFIETAK